MATARGEYHHFIPQFILKNFSHKFVCPQPNCKPKKSRHKHDKGKFPGDTVVNHLNMESEPYRLQESPVKRVFGLPDMYTDWAKPTTKEQRHIEGLFGQMESEASVILRKIVKTYEKGEPGLALTRDERNLLRKFIFLLKYRGSTFHRRFYHETSKDYNANDRELLHDYMKYRGFKTPTEVWFHNIKTIIELKMDVDPHALWSLQEKMYPSDALWFISHVQMYYMAICTPANSCDEFILTDNSYNVFEGPNTFKQSRTTGESVGGSHAPLHQFAPVSPKLMIVLRSNVLPNPEEDYSQERRQSRKDMLWNALGEDFYPEPASLLADLPIRKARNNYSETVHGAVLPRPGWDGTHRRHDRFGFYFFRISSNHVQKINGILLDNAFRSRTISFGSVDFFVKLIQWFIATPSMHFKNVAGTDHDSNLRYLKNLAALSKSLGSSKKLVWRKVVAPLIQDTGRYEQKYTQFRRMCERGIYEPNYDAENSPLAKLYKAHKRFCENDKFRFHRDLRMSGQAYESWIILESRLSAHNGAVWAKMCSSFTDRLCRNLPSSAFWLYLKRFKLVFLGDNDGTSFLVELLSRDDCGEGPEDVFSNLRPRIHDSTLNCLMYITAKNDLKKRAAPLEGVWPAGKFNMSRLAGLGAIKSEILDFPGQIKHCGIPAVEELAVAEEAALLRRNIHRRQTIFDLVLDDEDKLELLTRCRVKSVFEKGLGQMMGDKEVEAFKTVFFDLTFPTIE